MSDVFHEPPGATPLTPELREGLRFKHIVSRAELNEVEQANILQAQLWVTARRRNPISEAFGRNLHKRMLGEVWDWAGCYRGPGQDTNIGSPHADIMRSLEAELEQHGYWLENQTLPPDELAARFHHALVKVHPFPNGNGRWSRLMADTLLHYVGAQPFTWGRSTLLVDDETRQTYLAALREADRWDFGPLLVFVRS